MNSDFEPKRGIYALADPFTHRVMYIGKSMDIDYRYRQHCSADSNDNIRKSEWIGLLRSRGNKPELIELEKCDSFEDLDNAEKKWIREYKAKGEAELNVAVGGSARVAVRPMNIHREEWFQFVWRVKDARTSLLEVGDEAGRLVSAKHMDAIYKLVRKLDREVNLVEKRVRKEFPEWEDVSKALLATQNPAV